MYIVYNRFSSFRPPFPKFCPNWPIFSPADLSVILQAHYVTGKKFKLVGGLIVTVTFSPNVTSPLQCYNCFKFDQHIAENCDQESKTCERCGEDDHEYELCPNNPKCVNCTTNGDHESRDQHCPTFKELKNEKIWKAIFGITGEALRRHDDSKNDRYLQAKQREKDGAIVYTKMNEIEKNVKTKVDEKWQLPKTTPWLLDILTKNEL